MENKQTKGFTLIELLVVIGIVAILSAVVILTLNPAELLKQSRDSNRLSDMATLKSALSLYLADVITPVLAPSYTSCYVTNGQGTNNSSTAAGCGLFAAGTYVSTTVANLRNVNGTGWVPVDLTTISSGAPVGSLPVDPSNTGPLFYAYRASSSLVFEINVSGIESAKFTTGANDVRTTDGGNRNDIYEVGTAPGLAL
ncbi:MAG: type II secretion system protein [Candidatus Liptonbacteria bacterium]|nr:type II secretion system protein [Candidatus Liptonbacteria bacterium]